jgi:hypothetical protein
MNWKKFTIQLILWLVFVAIIPICTIVDKYDLVKNGTLKYTGWGIVTWVILFIVGMVILAYIYKLMKWSMWKQIIGGVLIVILPLIFLLGLTNMIVTNIHNIKYILTISIFSEAIAIPLNPFPRMIYEKNIRDIKEALK